MIAGVLRRRCAAGGSRQQVGMRSLRASHRSASASHEADDIIEHDEHELYETSSSAPPTPAPAAAPFHELLRHPARATWRSSPRPPPAALSDIRSTLLRRSGKTGRQLRRTHERVASIHAALADRRERERRDLANSRYRRAARPDSLEGRRRSAEDAAAAKPIAYGPEQTLANLRFRLASNYFLTRRVLAEARSLLGGSGRFAPRRIVDAGCGVGGASAAALDVFGSSGADGDDNRGVEWIHCVDPSRSMRDGCVEVLRGMMEGEEEDDDDDGDMADDHVDKDVQVNGRRRQQINKHKQQERRRRNNASARRTRITLSETLTDGGAASSSTGSNASGFSSSSGGTGSFDLALCTYTAAELPHVASSMALAAILWEKLAPNGVLVMIEPGTPDGFGSVRAVRNMLLDCCPPDDRHGRDDIDDEGGGMGRQDGDEEAHIIAPCTHAHACPMERHQKDHLATKKRSWNEEFSIDDVDGGDDDDDDDVDDTDDEEDDDEDELDYMDATEPAAATSTPAAETDAFERAFCSFVHAMPGGDNRSRGEKFSYLVVQKRITGARPSEADLDRATNPFHGESVADLLASSISSGNESTEDRASARKKKHLRRVGDAGKHSDLIRHASDLEDRFLDSDADELALELVRGDAARSSFGRIVRAPLKKRGLIMVDYCSGAAPEEADGAATDGEGDDAESSEKKGRIIRHKVSRRVSSRVAPGLYAAARKARWGGLWPNINDRVDSEGTSST